MLFAHLLLSLDELKIRIEFLESMVIQSTFNLIHFHLFVSNICMCISVIVDLVVEVLLNPIAWSGCS